MSDIAEKSMAENGDAESAGTAPSRPMLDRSLPLLALFLLVGLAVFIVAFFTVYSKMVEPMQPVAPGARNLISNTGSIRSNLVLSHWLDEGYFHYFGLTVRSPAGKVEIYRSLTGGYMVSAFILQKLFVAVYGHYSWRLVALHNELVAVLLSSLSGLLAYRVARRLGLERILALAGGASVVAVTFTFPSNLMLYWEMSPQAYWLLFATLFLLVEERCLEGRRTLPMTIVQAAAAFLMTYMEYIAGLAFVFVMAIVFLLLKQHRGSWKRFLSVVLAPALVAVALYGLQVYGATKRFPNSPMSGSAFLFRSGLDGESLYYGDHLDIAKRRDIARGNWQANRQYLFRWKWVFLLGVITIVSLIAAYVLGRVPLIALDVVFSLAGSWLVYAAVFSQGVMIHPYLYDVMLFTPLAISLFAFAPALAESVTRRSGVFVLIGFLGAFWYTLFQMRLFALQYPMPGTVIGEQAK